MTASRPPRNSSAGVNRPGRADAVPTTKRAPSGSETPGSARRRIGAIRRCRGSRWARNFTDSGSNTTTGITASSEAIPPTRRYQLSE
jgi:hypothetical protein